MKIILLGISIILYGIVWTLKTTGDQGIALGTMGMAVALIGFFLKENK